MKRMSFLDYVDANNKLREAVKKDPIAVVLYDVRKYCRIAVESVGGLKQYVSLKPTQQIVVEWQYKSDVNDTPDPLSIAFISETVIMESDVAVGTVTPNHKYQPFHPGDKVMKWLKTNAKESS